MSAKGDFLKGLGKNYGAKLVETVRAALGRDASNEVVEAAVKREAKAASLAARVPATVRRDGTDRDALIDAYGVPIADRVLGLGPYASRAEMMQAGANLNVNGANVRNKPPFVPPSQVPLVTQTGKRGMAVRGRESTEQQHPSRFGVFSRYKPQNDPRDTVVESEPFANMSDRLFDVRRLQNARVVSLLADKSRAGDFITAVNGLPTNVRTQGGPMYANLQEAMGGTDAFASDGNALSSVRANIRDGLDRGLDVFGVTTTMSPSSLDQSLDMTDMLHQMAQNRDISKSDLAVFDSDVRQGIPGYPGLLDEDAAGFMQLLTQRQRKNFVTRMDNAAALGQEFPDVAAARYALTDPNLVDVPSGATGYSFMRLGPESLVPGGNSPIRHRTYGDGMTGTYEGRGPLVPFNMMFRDFAEERRAAGASPGRDLRSLEFRKPFQDVDPETYDMLMKYLSGVPDPY